MRSFVTAEDGHQPGAGAAGGLRADRHQRNRLQPVDAGAGRHRRGSRAPAAPLNRLLQQVLDAETGSRGYLLTGDPRYLEPYNAAVAEISQNLDALRLAYAPERRRIRPSSASSRRNVQRKLAEMDLSVRMRKQGNEDAWKFVLHDRRRQGAHGRHPRPGRPADRPRHRRHGSRARSRCARSLLLARIGIARGGDGRPAGLLPVPAPDHAR